MNILLTGGTGYIGSHTAIALAKDNHQVILYDNLSNSNSRIVFDLKRILEKDIPLVQGDIRDTALLSATLKTYKIEAVIHLAGLKAVAESVAKPVEYYANNVQGTISLLQAMQATNIKKLVFSSSATVYGSPQYLPLDELHPTHAINPYGRTKLHIEELLQDVIQAEHDWSIICLRYFNPVGAHESGLIGENPNSVPNNLMPFIAEVAIGLRKELAVFGNNYPTNDGTGIRDYIHIMDLAEGHLSALNYLNHNQGWHVFNLGTGKGYSVLEMIKEFSLACGKPIPYKITARRPGDIAICYAKVDKATKKLSWTAKRDLANMCLSSWNYVKNRQKAPDATSQ